MSLDKHSTNSSAPADYHCPACVEQGWTKTHGFFLLMGGFVLEEHGEGKALLPLHPGLFHDLLSRGRIDFPNVLEADIEDHSKADWLAKLVVILQVTWFIVQCIARGASSKPDLTELEVVTLAFATLNAAMYFFWWNKPLDVKRAIRVPLKQDLRCKCLSQDSNSKEKDQAVVIQQAATSFEPLPRVETAMNVLRIWATIEKINKIPIVNLFSKPITAMVWCQDHMILPDAVRLPTFYSPTLPNPMEGALAMMTISVAGVSFGAVHFIGWNIMTPTEVEQYTWRVSTVAITATFFVNAINTSLLVYKLYSRPTPSESPGRTPLLVRMLEVLLGAIEILTVPFYIVGRICLFGLAFATLRSLPAGARKEIVWTSYLPHI